MRPRLPPARLAAAAAVVAAAAGVAGAAIPPPSYADINAMSTVLARVGADGLVAESWKGGLAVGAKPPAGSLGATAPPAVIGKTGDAWYASPILPSGLVTLRPPVRGEKPRPVTLAQLRGLVKTGALPPYLVRATLRWPRSPVTRDLEATWLGDRMDGAVALVGLAPPPDAKTVASVSETSVWVAISLPHRSVYLDLAVTTVDGDAIVATLKKTDPATASAKELDALLAP